MKLKKKLDDTQDKVSTDTDGHMCEHCYVDEVLDKKMKPDDQLNGGDDDEEEEHSSDSLSSWDSECARIYADVASKEVYDEKKVLKILHTK